MIKPFVKWVGGKRQLINEIKARLPEDYEERIHVEPFVGGGSVFLYLQPEKAYISDYNKELMNAYLEVALEPKGLLSELNKMKNTKDDYYKYRDRYNSYLAKKCSLSSAIEEAALFIYLNKTGFNGMYRLNKQGLFNVPWNKNPHSLHIIHNEDLLDTSKYLMEHVSIGIPKSYALVYEVYNSSDYTYKHKQFWYLDPPYAPLDKDIERGNFDQYTTFTGWDHDEQVRLRDFCVKLHKTGHKFMLSNSSCTLIKDLYKDFKIEEVDARRSISAKASTRSGCKEVIVTNY